MSNIQLANNLRVLRKLNKLTQTHLSTLLNISRQAYSNYENSKRTPDLDSLIRLSQIYQISLDQLVNQHIGQAISENKGPYLPGINIATGDTLYLTPEETDLLVDFRNTSSENRKIMKNFLKAQIKK
ncbi:MAG: helix-turn-helix domain-containing protein [Lachnospiraceae bacterium]